MSFTQGRISVHQDRVADAYQGASEALQEIWEEVIEHDRLSNLWVEDWNSKLMKDYQDEVDTYNKEQTEYQEDVAEYIKWKNNTNWFKGNPPVIRHKKKIQSIMRCFPRTPHLARHSELLNFTPESLKLKADVARASLEPLQLSPKEVEDMIGWENGSNIQKIKDVIEKKEGDV